MSVIMTAINIIMISENRNISGLNIPFMATSIIPLDDIAPKATPKLAIIINVLKETTFDPIAEFKKFHKKYLSKFFNSVHFLPFYPSSSDSGFAVKYHYKIDPRLGNWSDIKSFSKNSFISLLLSILPS